MKLIRLDKEFISIINCKVKDEFDLYAKMDRLTRRKMFEKDMH